MTPIGELIQKTSKRWLAVFEDKPDQGYYRGKKILQQVYYVQLVQYRVAASLYQEARQPTSDLQAILDRVERQLFYGNLFKDLAATTTDLYREIEPLLRAGRLPELMEQVTNLASRLMQTTLAAYLTKQFFNQLMSDVFHYFNDSKHERLEDF